MTNITEPDELEDDGFDHDQPEQPPEEKPAARHQNVEVEIPVTSTLKPDAGLFIVYLPAGTTEKVTEVIQNLPNINIASGKSGVEWAEALEKGTVNGILYDGLEESLYREDSNWVQTVVSPIDKNKSLTPRNVKLPKPATGRMTGEKASIYTHFALGGGTLHRVPLWHSGIWVTVKAPQDIAFVTLNSLIAQEKTAIGRRTSGLVFSNLTSITVERLMDFIIDHIYETSVQLTDKNFGSLKELILTPDIPILINAIICARHPRGFEYNRACINSPETCTYTAKDNLDPTKLLFFDAASLNDKQRNHMAVMASGRRTVEEVKTYQEEHRFTNKTASLSTEYQIQVEFKVPTLQEYIDAGHRWIDGIVATIDRVLASSASEKERNKAIEEYSQATATRQYSHWVKSINVDGLVDDGEIETIETILNDITSIDAIYEAFLTEVNKYINYSVIALIGIPSFDCPDCGTTNKAVEEPHSFASIIPLDLIKVFFALFDQHMARIRMR